MTEGDGGARSWYAGDAEEVAEKITERVYKEFTAEGIKLDAKGIRALNQLIDRSVRDGHTFEHQGFRDGLLQMHAEQMRAYSDSVLKDQRDTWDRSRSGWHDELIRDPEIGGTNLDRTLTKARGVLDYFLPGKDVDELLKHLDNNGMGSFPPFIRFLNNVAKEINLDDSGSRRRDWYGPGDVDASRERSRDQGRPAGGDTLQTAVPPRG